MSSQQVVLDQGPKVQNKKHNLEPHLAGDKGSAAPQRRKRVLPLSDNDHVDTHREENKP